MRVTTNYSSPTSCFLTRSIICSIETREAFFCADTRTSNPAVYNASVRDVERVSINQSRMHYESRETASGRANLLAQPRGMPLSMPRGICPRNIIEEKDGEAFAAFKASATDDYANSEFTVYMFLALFFTDRGIKLFFS